MATTFYITVYHRKPLYALAFQIGSAVLPGEQVMPVFQPRCRRRQRLVLPALSEWGNAHRMARGDWSAGDGDSWFALNGYLLFTWWWLSGGGNACRRIRSRLSRPLEMRQSN